MKTSKIKEVVNVSEPYGKFKTLYHNLVMDNGDKINIGKVKEQIVGWELTYEIVEEGQQEFNKAKSVQKDYPSNFNTQSKQTTSTPTKNVDVQDLIVKQSSLKAAVEFCNKDCTVEHLLDNAELFYNWVMSGEKPEATKDEHPF
tara:strand:- start:15874 stop:16305 length:432 start_codon:yes stop_codon:yes gene_type:complete